MSDTNPYQGSSAQRLTDLINNDNDTTLVLGSDFTFGPMSVYVDEAGRNTQVALIPGPGTRYKAATVHYTRLGIDTLSELPDGSLKAVAVGPTPIVIHDILPQINFALGLTLTVDEVQNNTFGERLDSYDLTIRENASLAWLGSTFQFAARHPDEPVPIDEVFLITNLSGLEYIPE